MVCKATRMIRLGLSAGHKRTILRTFGPSSGSWHARTLCIRVAFLLKTQTRRCSTLHKITCLDTLKKSGVIRRDDVQWWSRLGYPVAHRRARPASPEVAAPAPEARPALGAARAPVAQAQAARRRSSTAGCARTSK